MRFLAVLLTFLLLSGCAATGPAFTPAPHPDANAKQALVYIYRSDTFAFGGRDAYFYVNGVNVADLSRNGYTWFHAPAGTHQLVQKWPIDVSRQSLEGKVEWIAGETYYYKLLTDSESSHPTLTLRWRLAAVSPGIAEAELRATKYQPAIGASKLATAGGAR